MAIRNDKITDKITTAIIAVCGGCIVVLIIYFVYIVIIGSRESDRTFYESRQKQEVINTQIKNKYRNEINTTMFTCIDKSKDLYIDKTDVIKNCKKYTYSLYNIY